MMPKVMAVSYDAKTDYPFQVIAKLDKSATMWKVWFVFFTECFIYEI